MYARAKALGPAFEAQCPFRPNQPWDWVIRVSVGNESTEYWRDHFSEDANLIVHGAAVEKVGLELSNSADFTAADAVDGPASALLVHPAGGRERDERRIRERSRSTRRGRQEGQQPRISKVKVHKVGPDGKYTHTRGDIPICAGFKNGTCNESVLSSGTKYCARSREWLAHACDVCLGDHPAGSCGRTVSKPSWMRSASSGKGEKGGKGKGGGKASGKGGKGKGGKRW